MRIVMIIIAFSLALFSLRLLSTGLRTFIMFFKAEHIPLEARQNVYRDLFMGLLLLVLSIAMFI